jgi:hypothetical protein
MLPFVILCDPLWFNDLGLSTKEHKGFHEGSQSTFSTDLNTKGVKFKRKTPFVSFTNLSHFISYN